MHPCPIGRGLSLFANLYFDRLSTSRLPEEEAWDSEAGAIQSAQEEFIWERIEIIGSGTVSPTVGKAFRGVKKNTLLLLEFKERAEECLGTKAIPGARRPLPPPRSFGLCPKSVALG